MRAANLNWHHLERLAHPKQASRGVLGIVERLQVVPVLCPHLILFPLLLLVLAVLGRALIEQLRVCFHEQLQHVEGEPMHRAVPVLLGVVVQSADDYRKELLAILVDEFHDVVVVPEEKGALSHLEVGARDAAGETGEEDVLHAVELGRLSQLQGLLQLVQEEHLLSRDGHRPIAQHRSDDVVGQPRVLLNVLGHAVGELLVERCEGLDLVQRDQSLDQEVLVLILEGQSEAVDDAAQNLEQFADTVVDLALVDDLEEHVLDGPPDEGAQGHELAIDAVQYCLQVVALTRVL
mmetsp:Transcript_101351/g.205712  ORF Transcript_101351/g.205712 Transcript_101351/m.205712 type:complete len:292 (+) Transcript_101351:49-924(+)